MTIPIKSHLKRMKSVGHGPIGAKRRKLEMLALAQKELPHQEELWEMKSTSSEVSKSASLSSQQHEEVMDSFWDTLPRVDDTTGSTTAGLALEEVEEENRKREELEKKMIDRKKWEESLKEEEKKKRKPLHDEIAQLKGNQEHDRSTSQQLQEDIENLQREIQGKIDAEGRAVQELSKMLKEWLEDGKKKGKALVGVLNEYDGRLKVNTIQEFIHSSRFEDGQTRVIGPWFKNGFNFYLAQVKDVMQRAGHNLSILKGVNMGRKLDFPTEPYVTFPDEYLPSHPSSAKLPSPFKFLKDWTDEEEKKEQPESRRRSSRKR
ncbi:hypothetical protein Dimus_000909 [Dionaea muscipula]